MQTSPERNCCETAEHTGSDSQQLLSQTLCSSADSIGSDKGPSRKRFDCSFQNRFIKAAMQFLQKNLMVNFESAEQMAVYLTEHRLCRGIDWTQLDAAVGIDSA